MGLYYSGGIDWTWAPPPYATIADATRLTPPQPDYAAYADAHWRELIRRYQPAVLWNDIGAPAQEDTEQLFRDYYAAVADGVVNDRWATATASPHHDFRTAEFNADEAIAPDKWEAVRGMSRGFGYNANETDADYGPPEKFVHLLIDVVAKNGNLLLNVGPRADGSIPEPQLRILATGLLLANASCSESRLGPQSITQTAAPLVLPPNATQSLWSSALSCRNHAAATQPVRA